MKVSVTFKVKAEHLVQALNEVPYNAVKSVDILLRDENKDPFVYWVETKPFLTISPETDVRNMHDKGAYDAVIKTIFDKPEHPRVPEVNSKFFVRVKIGFWHVPELIHEHDGKDLGLYIKEWETISTEATAVVMTSYITHEAAVKFALELQTLYPYSLKPEIVELMTVFKEDVKN